MLSVSTVTARDKAPHACLLSRQPSVRWQVSTSLLEMTEPWPCWVALILFLGALYRHMSVVFSWVLNLWLNNFTCVCVFTFLTLHGFGLCLLGAQYQLLFSKAELKSESSASQTQALGHRQLGCLINSSISSSAVILFHHHHYPLGSWPASLETQSDPVRSNYF